MSRSKTFVLFVAFVVNSITTYPYAGIQSGALISLREAGNRSAPYYLKRLHSGHNLSEELPGKG